jgi:hypothetical protein
MRWLLLSALVLGVARIVAILVALALGVAACAPQVSGLHFEYRQASELQALQLDCVLELVSETGLEASGDVWLADDLQQLWNGDERLYGRTTGRDDFLRVDLLNVPALPQVFVHELIHVLAGQETNSRDPGHVNPKYFGPNSLTEFYAYQAFQLCQR